MNLWGGVEAATRNFNSILRDLAATDPNRKVVYVCFSAVYHAALKSVPFDERRALMAELVLSLEAGDVDTPGLAGPGAVFCIRLLKIFFEALDSEATRGKKFVFIVEGSASECVFRTCACGAGMGGVHACCFGVVVCSVTCTALGPRCTLANRRGLYISLLFIFVFFPSFLIACTSSRVRDTGTPTAGRP